MCTGTMAGRGFYINADGFRGGLATALASQSRDSPLGRGVGCRLGTSLPQPHALGPTSRASVDIFG